MPTTEKIEFVLLADGKPAGKAIDNVDKKTKKLEKTAKKSSKAINKMLDKMKLGFLALGASMVLAVNKAQIFERASIGLTKAQKEWAMETSLATDIQAEQVAGFLKSAQTAGLAESQMKKLARQSIALGYAYPHESAETLNDNLIMLSRTGEAQGFVVDILEQHYGKLGVAAEDLDLKLISTAEKLKIVGDVAKKSQDQMDTSKYKKLNTVLGNLKNNFIKLGDAIAIDLTDSGFLDSINDSLKSLSKNISVLYDFIKGAFIATGIVTAFTLGFRAWRTAVNTTNAITGKLITTMKLSNGVTKTSIGLQKMSAHHFGLLGKALLVVVGIATTFVGAILSLKTAIGSLIFSSKSLNEIEHPDYTKWIEGIKELDKQANKQTDTANEQANAFKALINIVDSYQAKMSEATTVITEQQEIENEHLKVQEKLKTAYQKGSLTLKEYTMLMKHASSVNAEWLDSFNNKDNPLGFFDAVKKGFNVDEPKSSLKELETVGLSVADKFSSAFDESVQKTRLSFKSLGAVFKDVTRSILADIARIAIKQAIIGTISGIAGFFGFHTGTTEVKHTGGAIGMSKIPSFHTGMASDERIAKLQVGEAVINRTGASRNAGAIDAMNRGMPVGGGDSTVVNVTYSPQVNALDPRTAQIVIAENAPTVVGIIRQAFNKSGQQIKI